MNRPSLKRRTPSRFSFTVSVGQQEEGAESHMGTHHGAAGAGTGAGSGAGSGAGTGAVLVGSTRDRESKSEPTGDASTGFYPATYMPPPSFMTGAHSGQDTCQAGLGSDNGGPVSSLRHPGLESPHSFQGSPSSSRGAHTQQRTSASAGEVNWDQVVHMSSASHSHLKVRGAKSRPSLHGSVPRGTGLPAQSEPTPSSPRVGHAHVPVPLFNAEGSAASTQSGWRADNWSPRTGFTPLTSVFGEGSQPRDPYSFLGEAFESSTYSAPYPQSTPGVVLKTPPPTQEQMQAQARKIEDRFGYLPISDNGIWRTKDSIFGIIEFELSVKVRHLTFTYEEDARYIKELVERAFPAQSCVYDRHGPVDGGEPPIRPHCIQLVMSSHQNVSAVDQLVRKGFVDLINNNKRMDPSDVRLGVDIVRIETPTSGGRGSNKIVLNPACKLRPHQEAIRDFMFPSQHSDDLKKILSQIRSPYANIKNEDFGKSRIIRSGQVDVPCGGGKTLCGIAASTMLPDYSILVLCNSGSMCNQWASEFVHWTNLERSNIVVLSSDTKCDPSKVKVWITTYKTMGDMGKSGSLSLVHTSDHGGTGTGAGAGAGAGGGAAAAGIHMGGGGMGGTPWDPMRGGSAEETSAREHLRSLINGRGKFFTIADESQNAAANITFEAFRQLDGPKLAMTATRYREDKGMSGVSAFVGRVVLVCMWAYMERHNMIAKVECFNMAVRDANHAELNSMLTYRNKVLDARDCIAAFNDPSQNCNPLMLIRGCELAAYVSTMGKKVILFSTSIKLFCAAVDYISRLEGVVLVGSTHGEDSVSRRDAILSAFRNHVGGCVLILSAIGDVGLDAPDCTAVVQIGVNEVSNVKHAQRMGRALRPFDGEISFFFTVCSHHFKSKIESREEFIRSQMYTPAWIESFPQSGKGSISARHAMIRRILSKSGARLQYRALSNGHGK